MSSSSTPQLAVRAATISSFVFALGATPPAAAAEPVVFAPAQASAASRAPVTLAQLLGEALQNNPEIRAARKEQEAAGHRVSPAGALDDPMLEAGVLNLPTRSLSFDREDMTMKMLGLAQRFPYPGKRDLRRAVAERDAESVGYAAQETVNRVARELKIAYYDLALVLESTRVIERNRALLEQLVKIAEGRYSVGQGSQVDVLRAHTQLAKMVEELIKLGRERPMLEADIVRLLGRRSAAGAIVPDALELRETALPLQALQDEAINRRPQLLALQTLTAKSERARELAHRERYPDFDVRFSYGQRDRMPDGTPRSDMVSLTVAMNLPVWRQTKIAPRIAEAQAMHEQGLAMLEAQRNETLMKLRQQVATAEQNLRAAALYRNEILPQSRLTLDAAMAAYQVNRVEFAPLLDNQMTIYNFEIAHATAVANYNKALAEIDLLTGRAPQ